MKKLAFILLAACGATGDDSGGPGEGVGEGGLAGILTAGEIDDNKNFAKYLDGELGMFRTVQGKIPLTDRIQLTLVDETESPIANADVTITSGKDRIHVVTGTDGRAVLLPKYDGFVAAGAKIEVGGWSATAPDGANWRFTLPANSQRATGLDLVFVVDATGSMGDEINYLKDEVEAIANRVAAEHEGVTQRYGLIVYRDSGDDYVTRTFDFTANLSEFKSNLAAQSAGGGGDYPEAAEVAMEKMLGLTWRDGNVARLVFQIADAPPHTAGYTRFLDTGSIARTRGIRIFPVAASGVAIEAEYLMRTSALMTGGRYLFLTDHSGVGNPHAPPHFPCYQVQHLNDLLERTIDSELSGTYVPAREQDIVATVGTFRDGVCQ